MHAERAHSQDVRAAAPSTPAAHVDHSGAIAASVVADRVRRRREWIWVRCAQVAVVVVVLGLWELASRREWINPFIFGRPSLSWEILRDEWRRFVDNAIATAYATLVGFGLAAVTGTLAGLTLAAAPRFNRIFDPWITVLNSVPRIALVPTFILWFGISDQTKMASAFSLAFFIMLINARAGMQNVEPDLVIVTRLLGARRRTLWARVIVPSAFPSIFAGLRLSITYALLGVVASEMIASRDGLGQQVSEYGNNLRPAGVFAVLAVLAVFASLLSAGVKALETHLFRWKE